MAKIDFSQTPGEYEYTQTPNGKSASGVVKMGAASERNGYQQRIAGGQDRQLGDQGGHLIPHSMGGRNDATNLDAQNANVNQIGQRGVERQVADLAKDPNNTVFLDVQNYNREGVDRPDATMITVAVQDNRTGDVTVDHFGFQNTSYAEQAQWDAIANANSDIDPRQDIGMTAEERDLANAYAEQWDSISVGAGDAEMSSEIGDGVSAVSDEGVSSGGDAGADNSEGADDGMGIE